MINLDHSEIGRILRHAPYLIEAEACRRSLFDFTKAFWPVVIDEDPIWNWHIELICLELEELLWGVISRKPKAYDLVINVSPGTTKTTICSVMFPAWAWVARPPAGRCGETVEKNWSLKSAPDEDPRPKGWNLRFITGSYASDITLKSSSLSRDIIRSDKYQTYFPELSLRADQDAKSDYSNTKKGARFSTSVGARVMGTHAHIQVIDDPVDPEQALSDADRLRANNFMDNLNTRSVDKRLTPLVLIMQRLHEDDPTAHVLKRRKNVRHIKLPADDSWDIQPPSLKARYVDGLFDPIRMGRDVLEDQRRILGSYKYAGQFGQDPRPREGGMFQKTWFEIVPGVPDSPSTEVRGWDLAATKKKQGAAGNAQAATAGIKLKIVGGKLLDGKLVGGTVYIIDDVNIFGTAGEVRKTIINTASQDGFDCIQDFPQDPGQAGKAQVKSIAADLHGYPVRSSVESGDKVVRADPLSAQVEAGNIKLVKGNWNEDFLEEVSFFPNGRKDRVDAMVRAYNRALIEVQRGAATVGGPAGVRNARSMNPDREAA
jgi:predicted phage terminase large subunit-like protein